MRIKGALKRKAIAFTAFLLALCFVLPLLSPMEASANVPSRRTIRVGLSFGTTAVPSGNLVNAVGNGFEFGYYDSNLNFTAVASTTEKSISIMVDRNMQWNSSAEFSGQYQLTGNNGLNAPNSSTFIGFAHVQMNSGKPTLAAAQSDLGGRSDGFIRYNAGAGNPFVPMFGNYTSSAQAESNKGSGSVNTGTARTITVAALGTSKILFEFDNSSNTNLIFGIRPMNNARPSTHYRGYRYYGGFRFERREATSLTVVNIVGLEDYVMGVVPYEMSSSWPLEALKAQAICARTYVLANLNKYNSSQGFDVCTTANCQVYRGLNSATATTDSAVTSTAGQVVTYNGSLISTYYSSSHGGGSENNENIWAGTALPYLRGVLDNYEDSVSSSISQYNWTLSISQSELTQRVRNAGHSGASTITSLRISQYSPTGNVVSVVARDSNGRDYTFSRRAGLQSLFGSTALRSQRFNIGSVVWTPGGAIFVNSPAQSVSLGEYHVRTGTGTSTVSGSLSALDGAGNVVPVVGGGGGVSEGIATGPVGGNFVLTGRGWGHSIGMSQWGAYAQARNFGRTAEQIIRHYFTGVAITKT